MPTSSTISLVSGRIVSSAVFVVARARASIVICGFTRPPASWLLVLLVGELPSTDLTSKVRIGNWFMFFKGRGSSESPNFMLRLCRKGSVSSQFSSVIAISALAVNTSSTNGREGVAIPNARLCLFLGEGERLLGGRHLTRGQNSQCKSVVVLRELANPGKNDGNDGSIHAIDLKRICLPTLSYYKP
ncbi:hypothetical protein TWF106_006171 [Orbilia oligospora]|uniref:Uncharacterized protein n=1 Tax=Orbilia oligospora TaxID=2813651 RepID=A0A7C8U2U8_ORBOL|nr:hypothetical protein TWF106_006171 [Orbilia oligospora]